MRPDEAGEARVKRMALDGAEERARPCRGPCTFDSPTQCTSPGLSFCLILIVDTNRTDSPYFNNYRATKQRCFPMNSYRESSERTNRRLLIYREFIEHDCWFACSYNFHATCAKIVLLIIDTCAFIYILRKNIRNRFRWRRWELLKTIFSNTKNRFDQ